MQLLFARKVLGMYVEPIIKKILPNETGAARLQQVGLFTLIFVLEENGEPVTAARLAQVSGQARNAIYLQIKKLRDVKVVGERRALNKAGRGYETHFFVEQNAKTKQLLRAIARAAEKKAAGKKR